MTLQEFNQLQEEKAIEALEKCSVSKTWCAAVAKARPFANEDGLLQKAAAVWYTNCKENDYKEAFTGHPKIGDISSLKEKFSKTKDWAGNEQSGMSKADEKTIEELADFNQQYEAKFGYIFIVSASGKSAAEMLRLIKIRIEHEAETELTIAMGEQHKITNIRLAKLIDNLAENSDQSSHITTHVLDTSTGIPGKGIVIKLQAFQNKSWQTIALGITNSDGRIANLLPPAKRLAPAIYQMQFETDDYYTAQKQTCFYPLVDIQFKVVDESHYHIPLLLNPYGFTTYRGS